MKLNKEINIADIATAFISIIALIASIIYSQKSEKFNELSVSPYLDITYTFPIKNDSNANDYIFGIRTDNPGNGPAVIEKLEVSLIENGEISISENWNNLSDLLKPDNVSFTIFKKGNALKSGRDTLQLFYVKPGSDAAKNLKKLIESKSLDVKIYYKSLNGHHYASSLQGGRTPL